MRFILTTMHQQLFDFIRQFIDLTPEEEQAIRDLAIFRMFGKGELLHAAGQVPAEQYLVLKGCIRCFYVVDGEEKTTAFYMEQDALEPIGADAGQPCPYSIMAVEDSIIGVALAANQDALFAKFPRFEGICRQVSEHQLAKTRLEFDAFRFMGPTERYLHVLENRPELVQRVPQHQLASFLGMTPESLSRIRRRIMQQQRDSRVA